jgi:uncharacterized membrane protein YdjX (TVP38/TMEM64 family)/rhodanese-related sulfurtransferase
MSKGLARVLVAIALVVAIGLAFLFRDRLDPAALEAWVAGAGAAGPLLFIVIYALATVLFLPGAALTLVGGALFGPVAGTLYNLTGATIGAVIAFLAARHLAADWVRDRAGPRLDGIMGGVETEGWRFVAFTRLVPLFPFNLLNYVLGLTRIPLAQYALASALFMLPGAIVYTYLGYAGREALAGSEGLLQKGLIALSLLGALAFLPRLVARLRARPMLGVEELKRRIDAHQDLLVLDVRTTADFVGEQGHIAGATNIPLEALEARLDELTADLERPIALVCRTDRRSAKAAALLARRGFADVHVVQGGMTAWLGNGWAVEDANPKPE